MTAKAGDSITLPVSFEVTTTGAAQTYANAAAFTGAGGTITWYNAGVALGSQPSWTLTPLGSSGVHWLSFAAPQGVDSIVIVPPSGITQDPRAYVMAIGSADADSIDNKIATSNGTSISADRQMQYDWTMVEGDTWIKEMVFPSTALGDFGYTNFADLPAGAWTFKADARKQTNKPPAAADFSFVAIISDKVNNKVKLMVPKGLTGAAVDYTAGDSTAFEYDGEAIGPLAFAITGVSVGSKTFTIAGDQRLYFGAGDTFTVTGSTGNNATYTIVSAALVSTNTVVTVTATPASAVADGTINTAVRITGIVGTFTITRQETVP